MTNPNDLALSQSRYAEIPQELPKFPSTGLTKREYFAAMAMQGLCANSIPGQHHQFEFLTAEAVQYADALINELNNNNQ